MATILVVDDEDPVRTIIKDSLEHDNHQIKEATNGNEALTICNDHSIDLIITDLVMPEKTGIDLIMAIKNITPDMSIIAISGGGGITGRFDYLEIAKSVGAFTVINKPFSVMELRKAVSDVLTGKDLA